MIRTISAGFAFVLHGFRRELPHVRQGR
jgi:hypothetical protein